MAKNILFIVEGERDEPNLIISIFKRALDLSTSDYKIFKFKSNIYSLYDKMVKEEYESLLSMLYSMDKRIFPSDFLIPEAAFSSVYLIFDLDPQSPTYSKKKITRLSEMFSDESRNGKLYLNVPMSQSIFNFQSFNQDKFNNQVYAINRIASFYKKDSRENSFLKLKYRTASFRSIKTNDIYSITMMNMKKYCFLTDIPFSIDWNIQSDALKLFEGELIYIEKGWISPLCGSLLLIPDYSPLLVSKLKDLKD